MLITAFNTSYKQYNYPVTKKDNENFCKEKVYSSKPLNFGLNYANLQQIKTDFVKEGINYLMPNEIWSDFKIEKVINRFDKNIKNLIKTNNLTKKSINTEINAILPKDKQNSVKIFDTNELKNYFLNKGISPEEAEEKAKNCSGMQICENNISKIFIPLKSYMSDKQDKFTQLALRMTLAHELTHSLQTKFQNNQNTDEFHRKRLDVSHMYMKDFFHNFEEFFYPKFSGENVYIKSENPCEKNFYKFIKEKNEKSLFKQFDSIFKNLLGTKYKYYNNERHDTKQFFTNCKNLAHDEKIAYKTTNIMSELFHNKKCPINYDYRSLLYEKMEKYFDIKAIAAKEAYECTREYKFKNLYG